MLMDTPRLSRPPIDQRYRGFPGPGPSEAVAGELWTVKKDGEDWPVVICDEEIVLTFFKGNVRPFNARRADGNWPGDYNPGGLRVCQRSYPTVTLGLLRFTWVSKKILEPFDKEMGEVIQASTTNPDLAQGWSEAMRLHAMEDPLPELKISIRQRRLERSKPKYSTAIDDVGSVKRKGTPLSKYPPSPRVEEVDDEEPEDLFVRQESSIGHRIKKESSDLASFANMDVDELSVDLTRSDSEQPQKKSRLDALGRSSMRSSTPLRAATQGLVSRYMSTNRATPGSNLEKKVDDPTRVTVYVDNPHTGFVVSRSGLDASPFLSKMVGYHPDHGLYVMSPALSALNKVEFMPIGQYLERGEYDPNILDEGTEWVRLETNVIGQDAGEEVIRCGIIYDIARTLELPGLQDLAFRKLKALAKNEPHQPFAILCLVARVFKDALPDMRQYLVEYLAEQFWNMMKQENGKLAEVMEADEDLQKRVFGLKAGQPQTEVKHKAEGKMKDGKMFGEGKDEPESPGSVVGNEAESGLLGDGTFQEDTPQYPVTVHTSTDEDTTAEKEQAAKHTAQKEKAKKDKSEKEKAAGDRAKKEKAERNTAKRMTAKELLTDNDALVDQAAAIISAAGGNVSFGGPDPATATATAGEIQEKGLSQEELEMIKLVVGEVHEERWSQEDQEMIAKVLKESDDEATAEKESKEALQQAADAAGTSGIDDRKGWAMID